MSLSINYNSAANSTHGKLSANDASLTKSIERLSSGFKINRASDGPAALVNSEKLRAQVSGLGQAITNAGDAVNMVKTAEGALGEVHRMLRSMRDLAVHAANTGATDAAAAQADQAQIDNAINSLNKVASETQFGNRNLLDGSAGIKSFVNGSKVMAGDFSFAKGLESGADIKISISEAASQAHVTGKRADGMDATGYSSATYASADTALGVAGNIAFTDKDGATHSISYSATDTVDDLVSAVNAIGTSTTGITAEFQASTGKIAMIKTDDPKGTDDTFSWTATGSHAVASSTATYANDGIAIGGDGSVTLLKDDGSSATVTWKATDTVDDVVTAVNNLGVTQTGITAAYNATTGAIDMTKTGSFTGNSDVLSWSAAGSNAATSSEETFTSGAATMSAGSLTLSLSNGASTTVSWNTGSTVTQMMAEVNSRTADTGITASYNASSQKIDLVKTDATTGAGDVLAWTARGSDAVVSSVVTFAGTSAAIGAGAAGDLTLTLTNGQTKTLTMLAADTVDDVISAVNSWGTAYTGITASFNAGTGTIDFTMTDDRKGAADTMTAQVSAGTFFSGAAAPVLGPVVGNGVDTFAMATTVAGKDVFAQSFSTTGSEVFAASSTITGATVDNNNFATEDGSLYVNGVKIDYSAGDSTSAFLAKINAKSDLTGATASMNTTSGRIEVNSNSYGSKATLNITGGDLLLGDGISSSTTAGTDAKAAVTKTINGTTSNVSDQYWTKGDGLTIKDSQGNSVVLNTAGGAATSDASSEFTVEVNTLTFQVGAYAEQTRDVNINAVFAHNLGNGAVADKNVSNLDLTTGQGAQDAIKVLDKAISDISGIRANLGATQTNVLESSINSLSIAKENLTASESSIRDTDMAAEMIQFTKFQILQNAGFSMESQANSGAQAIGNLLR